jgi:sugar (pentulose or hexulose) kinase
MTGEFHSGRYFLGIDLGGTNVKAGVVDDGGHSRSSVSRPTEAAKGPRARDAEHFPRRRRCRLHQRRGLG